MTMTGQRAKKSSKDLRNLVMVAGLMVFLLSGCLNPFAPEEGDLSSDIWDPQVTVGGLLDNFRTSYALQDSLRYADLIAEEFVFQYFDFEVNRYEQWYRETELTATGGLMSSVDRLDLRWGTLTPASMDTFSIPDTTVEFTVRYMLTAGQFASLNGFARFQVRTGDDGRFRIVMWKDDF